jgi:hypothetical protein
VANLIGLRASARLPPAGLQGVVGGCTLRGMDADRTETEHRPNTRRVTVAEAAVILGITAEAVRTRIKRGKLDSVKEPPDRTGTVYVLLQVDSTGPNDDPTSQGKDRTSDQTLRRDELVDALREQVAYLQGVIAVRDRELDQRTEEIRRRDAALEREQQLTALFATRLGELEAPREERQEVPQTPAVDSEGSEPRAATEGAQEAAQRPWWRRVFGG